MNFKEIFNEFVLHKKALKVLYVASSDSVGQPNCAPKMLIDSVAPNTVYLIDYDFTKTHANLIENSKMSLSFMDDTNFRGYRLNGVCKFLPEGEDEYVAIKAKWEKRLNYYEADRIHKRMTGRSSTREDEGHLPKNFSILKFTAKEASVVHPTRVLRSEHSDLEGA